MSGFRANMYTPDGRLRGSYVYMLLCQVQAPIYVRVGRAVNPFYRLEAVRESSGADAIAVAEVHSTRKALAVERDLHTALAHWHMAMGWYLVAPDERREFNAAWRPVIQAHSTAARPLDWNHYSVTALIAETKAAKKDRIRSFMGRGRVWRDFSKV